MRKCPCGSTGPFYKDRTTKDGQTRLCKACTKRRDAGRDRSARVRHGMTPEELAVLKSAGCAICGSIERLTVDHDHACCPGNEGCLSCVRGVLCARHNTGLGQFHDDPDELRLAVAYLDGAR